MSFKIVIDSCCELPEKYNKDPRIEIIPLSIELGEHHIVDDETFDQKQFLNWVATIPSGPKSSCPSPEQFMKACETDADDVYIITISSKLSGTHNSAVLGRNLYLEKAQKNIYICDSESAVSGEGQVALKALELAEQNLPFEEVVEKLEAYRDEMGTYFVLNNLDILRKSGRLSGVKALVASTLNIKPVMGAEKGTIVQYGQAIGINKALNKMVELVIKERPPTKAKSLLIAHCNCPDRALHIKNMLLEKADYKEIMITGTKAISSMYASDGGIVIGG